MSDAKLIERAQQLTSVVNWMTEYHDRWVKLEGLCKAQLNMCIENKSGDPAAIDLLTSMIAMCEVKKEKTGAWLRAKTPKLHALMTEVNYGD